MRIQKIEIQDDQKNIYYPHTDSSVVKYKDSTAEETLDNFNTQLNNKLNKTSVINNCTTTEEGFALDARQGKLLSETMAINTLSLSIKNKLKGSEDLNNIVMTGIYDLISNDLQNTPVKWGILEVVANNVGYIKQTATSTDGDVFVRIKNTSGWTTWKQVTLS